MLLLSINDLMQLYKSFDYILKSQLSLTYFFMNVTLNRNSSMGIVESVALYFDTKCANLDYFGSLQPFL